VAAKLARPALEVGQVSAPLAHRGAAVARHSRGELGVVAPAGLRPRLLIEGVDRRVVDAAAEPALDLGAGQSAVAARVTWDAERSGEARGELCASVPHASSPSSTSFYGGPPQQVGRRL
jgi:hypothetical protein